MGGQRDNAVALTVEEGIGPDKECIGSRRGHRSESGIEFAFIACMNDLDPLR